MLVVLLGCVDPGPSQSLLFVVDPVDQGPPVAAASGFDAADGEAMGLAFAYTLPIFGHNPAWEVPAAVRALIEPDTVRDPAACPFEVVDGDVRSWVGGCRSSQGYDFEGEATERSWIEDGVERYRWAGELEVIGDREDPAFDRVYLAGAIEQAVPLEGTVTHHLDLNLRIEVDGYWSRHDPNSPAATAWADWAVSGSFEQREDFWVSQVAAEVGGAGGFRFDSVELDADRSCPVEVVGEGDLSDQVSAVLEGVESCDACARVGNVAACAP